MQTVDTIIVGAGMVGSTLALMLGQCGYRVLLVEQFPSRPVPQDGDVRTMALSYASQVMLSQLGIWRSLSSRAAPIENLCVTVKGQLGSTHLKAPAKGITEKAALGYVVSVGDIDAALQEALLQTPNVTIARPATVVSHQPSDQAWSVSIVSSEGQQEIKTRLLIAADGVGSLLAKSQSIAYQNHAYHHHAICANMVMETNTPHTAFERFLKEGALALLPWIPPYATCIWTINEPPEHLLALSDSDYIKACQQAFGQRIGRIKSVGKRVAYPLSMQVAARQIDWRFLIMGNAAHQIHPVAAQGLNLSLQDIAGLRSLLANRANPADLGDPAFLEDYQQLRWPEQAKVIYTTDKIAKIMSTDAVPSTLRGLGITLLDMVAPLKQQVIRWGMGLA